MTEDKESFQQHDSLFNAAFGSKEDASRLLKSLLPEALVRQMDFTSLEPRPTKYTGPHLEKRHSDFLFDVKIGGRDALVYVLVEHQSSNDRFMIVRLLLYMALTWDGLCRSEKPPRYVPPIVPVVVHHSEEGFTTASRFEDVVEPEILQIAGLLRYIPRFETLVDDLRHASDEELQQRGLGALQALALWMLRDARNPERFFRHLKAWAHLLNELARNPETSSGIELVMQYITSVLGQEQTDQLRTQLAELAPAAEAAMQSIAEAFEKKGHEKGLAEGEEKGQKNLLKRQLVKKFGPLSDDILARLDEASEEQLERYGERILEAERIEQVFE